jgi:hypothetical protein
MTPRTLVVSDLHIGASDGLSVVERPAALAALLGAIDGCERLVLLGDLIELKDSDPWRSMDVARPILQAIGARAGADRQIVYLPGNHDRALIGRWIAAQGAALRTETPVPPDAGRTLATVLEWLAPARVEVRYPGVWLSELIWAHHGHYLNYYLEPHQGYGLLRRERTGRPRHGAAPAAEGSGPDPRLTPSDFEVMFAHHRLHVPARTSTPREPVPDPSIVMQRPWHARLHEHILSPRISPVVANMLGRQMRRHAIPAVVYAAHDLGVRSSYLLFGHVHRRGPIAGDWLQEWRLDETEVLNTGSWRFEPVLVQRSLPPHPYWPGGAILIDEQGTPRTLGLLDDLTAEQLTVRHRRRP